MTITLQISTAHGTLTLPMTTTVTPILSIAWRDEVTPTLGIDETWRLGEFVGDEYAFETIAYAYTDGQRTADESRDLDGTFEYAWAMLLDGVPVDHATLQAALNSSIED